MSIAQNLENAAEAIFRKAEEVIEEIDGAALAEARKLIADAKAAEEKVVSLAEDSKTEIEALVAQYEPEIAQAVITVAEKLLSDITALFGVAS